MDTSSLLGPEGRTEVARALESSADISADGMFPPFSYFPPLTLIVSSS
jgi:hypothetical protein